MGKEKNLLEKSSFWEENRMIDMEKALQNIDDVIEKGPYKDTWASLSSWQTPKWYQKAKFGIFIHWGVYS